MSAPRREREMFIARAVKEGLDLDTARALLSAAATLQRLAEAQCNGDWPYNGDRDRPSMEFRTCEHCNGTAKVSPRPWRGAGLPEPEGYRADDCLDCQGTGKLQTNGRARMRWDAQHAVCAVCEAPGVSRSVLRKGGVCPDCRKTASVKARMAADAPDWAVILQGDPRGYVLKVRPASWAGRPACDAIGVPA